MRWIDLFADLEGQWDAEQAAEFDAEVAELAQAERAALTLASRLKAAIGDEVVIEVAAGDPVDGTVADVAAAWVLLQGRGIEHVVPLAAVVSVRGLGGRASELGPVAARLSLGHALRALAEQRNEVRLVTSRGEHHGVVLGAAADHVRVRPSSGGEVALAYSHLVRVSSL